MNESSTKRGWSVDEPSFWAVDRAVIEAAGPDARSYLQGQLSQDIDVLAVGDSVWSLLLDPQGKLVVWLRVTCIDPERFWLDTAGGWGDTMTTRLERFRLRVRCEFTELRADCVAVRGAGAGDLPTPQEAVRAAVCWPGVEGADFLSRNPIEMIGVAAGTESGFERQRIDAGLPAMGSELEPGLIAAEAGIVQVSVSFTKGCYTGQELVARIDSRGNNTPRRLYRLRASDPKAALVAGADLLSAGASEGGEVIGRVTSAIGDVALAYVTRSAEVPGSGIIEGSGEVEVLALTG